MGSHWVQSLNNCGEYYFTTACFLYAIHRAYGRALQCVGGGGELERNKKRDIELSNDGFWFDMAGHACASPNYSCLKCMAVGP